MYNGNKTLQDINSQNIISENVSTDEIEANSILFKKDDGREDRFEYSTNKNDLNGIDKSKVLVSLEYFENNKGGEAEYPSDITTTSITNTNTTNDAVIHSNIFEADEVVSGSLKYKPVIKGGNLF